jgi:hypothetical protein
VDIPSSAAGAKACDLARARELHEQVLTAPQRLLGDDHPDTLVSQNNLARTLYGQGDLAAPPAL